MEDKSELLKRLEIARLALEKQFKDKNILRRLGDDSVEAWPAISTGAYTLDRALGIGGLPVGRIIEIFGPASAGKTTIALSAVAAAQRQGKICAFIDMEYALDPVYAKALGVDLDELLISQPAHAEAALNVVDELVRTEAVGLIVIDSVPALVPKAELDGDVGDHTVGLQARLMGQTLRKITGSAARGETTIIFINQIREKIGVMFGSPETTPGGRALPFYASVRIDVRKMQEIKSNATGEQLGTRVKAKIIKNKMAAPYRVAEFDIVYGEGIDNAGCVVDYAEKIGIFGKSGAWYYLEGENFAQGRAATIAKLKGTPGLIDEVLDIIKKKENEI